MQKKIEKIRNIAEELVIDIVNLVKDKGFVNMSDPEKDTVWAQFTTGCSECLSELQVLGIEADGSNSIRVWLYDEDNCHSGEKLTEEEIKDEYRDHFLSKYSDFYFVPTVMNIAENVGYFIKED